MTRKALGRGLSALIGEETDLDHKLAEIDIDLIGPNPHQARRHFKDGKLLELAASIKATGVLQPVVLRKTRDRFEIIAGERRWRAARMAGLPRIPAVIREIPDERLLESSLIENIQREDLNPIEEARAYHSLAEDSGLTQDQIAQRVGKDRSSVTNYLRLLKLPDEVQGFVESAQISMGHARSVLALPDPAAQTRLAREIVLRGLSVRDTERLVNKLKRAKESPRRVDQRIDSPPDPNIRAAEERLRKRFSTVVRILPGQRGGKIEIDYLSGEDLERIFDLLIGKIS